MSKHTKEIKNFEKVAHWFKSNSHLLLLSKQDRKRARKREYMQKYLKNVDSRLKHNLRSRFYNAIKRGSKKGSVIQFLGCSINDLKKHLESQFQPGMTWENYGKWEIDHNIPLNSCNVNEKEQLKKFCNFKNLQPLWKTDNRKKSAKNPKC